MANKVSVEFKDLVKIFMDLCGVLNFYWNVYVVVNIAIVGWLARGEKISYKLGVVGITCYSIFCIINGITIARTYKFLNLACNELRQGAQSVALKPESVSSLEKLSYGNRLYLCIMVHVVIYVGVIFLIVENTVWGGLTIGERLLRLFSS